MLLPEDSLHRALSAPQAHASSVWGRILEYVIFNKNLISLSHSKHTHLVFKEPATSPGPVLFLETARFCAFDGTSSVQSTPLHQASSRTMKRSTLTVFSRRASSVPMAGNMPRMPPKRRDFGAEVAAVNEWWSSDRFSNTVRPYKAEVRLPRAFVRTAPHPFARTSPSPSLPSTGCRQAARLHPDRLRRRRDGRQDVRDPPALQGVGRPLAHLW